jgi:hypothetical protein
VREGVKDKTVSHFPEEFYKDERIAIMIANSKIDQLDDKTNKKKESDAAQKKKTAAANTDSIEGA